jgi:Domain of unknown function (DUF2804), C-terminal
MDVPHAFHAPFKGGRPLKRWRYVGVFGEDVMACFGVVRIGGLPQAFWAVLDGAELRERTRFRTAAVELRDGVVRVRDVADLVVEPAGEAIEVTSRHGAQQIWTRKTPARVRGTLAGRAVDLPALVDDSAGYHARVTEWEWAAGAGLSSDGRDVRWNLVTGIHDGPTGSERRVWLDGVAHEVGPVTFSAALDEARFAEGGALRFAARAERARRDELLVFASDYRQPFGTVTGTLPGGIELVSGAGVMERHRARW